MFRQFTDWVVSLLGNSRELSDHRVRLKHLEERVRDLEEGLRMMSQQLRHEREVDATARENLLLKIEGVVAKAQLPLPRERRKKAN